METFKVIDNTSLAKAELEEKIKTALDTIGIVCESHAKKNCPVDTGNLRNSITHKVGNDNRHVVIGTNVEYAPYVENGTSNENYPKQPFLKPAIEDNVNQYRMIVEKALK